MAENAFFFPVSDTVTVVFPGSDFIPKTFCIIKSFYYKHAFSAKSANMF